MTDSTFHYTRLEGRGVPLSQPKWLVRPLAAFALTSVVGVVVGHAMLGDSAAFEPNLIMLLRFMAIVKFAGVFAAMALVEWRLAGPVSRDIGIGYVCSVALMAVAPGLIWSLAHIWFAVALFHVGLLAFLVLAWKDHDTVGRVRSPLSSFDNETFKASP